MRRAFTLIEILVVIAIIGTMAAVGIANVGAGKAGSRVKGSTRDVFAAIRQARSTALVTGQPVIITYSTVREDEEVMAKIEITSAKLFSSEEGKAYETLSGRPIEGDEGQYAGGESSSEGRELVHIRGSKAKSFAKDAKTGAKDAKPGDSEHSGDSAGGGGETIEEILFAPINVEVVKGVRLKVAVGDEELDESAPQNRSRISVFSNVDYLLGRFNDAKAEAKKKEEAEKQGTDGGLDDKAPSSEELQAPVSVAWESNGRVEPHKVWIYADGKRPEDGLMISVDRFGAAKVLSGDGREE